MTDCLIVGFNDYDFASYVKMVEAMGVGSGAYRDLRLAFVTVDGRPMRALDVLTAYRGGGEPAFHNADFLWPTIPYLGTFLHRRGFTFDYVNLFQAERDRLREKLARGDVLSVAITTTLYVIPEPIVEIVSFVRRCDPRVTIVVGGPYVRNQTTGAGADAMRTVFKYVGADVYVDSSEGELALTRVLAALKDGAPLDGIANVAYRRGDDYVMNPTDVESNALADNPPDYRLFARDLGQFVSLRTAKSCPFACAFCGFPGRAGAYTYLPVELVERELDALRDLGTVTTVTFLDDTFNVPKRRFKDILKMMIRKRYGFRWNAFYRSDHGDAEAIALMAESGCEGVFLGVESGSAAMLERMNKTARPDDYLDAIPRLRAAGISTYASLIVGYPGETFETVRETIEFLESARPDFYRAQLWYADHQTPVWKDREALGIEGEGFNWRHLSMDSLTASDLVDTMFLAVRGSTWMPQYGFEQWSTFYLQRRGMTLAQVKTFVRCFNEAVKDGLLHPERAAPDPELLANLRRSCRFDHPAPAVEPERFPAEAYVAAERFWTRMFAEPAPSAAEVLSDRAEPGVPAEAEVVRTVERDVLASAVAATGVDATSVALAAFVCVLSRLSGGDDIALTVQTLPLRTRVDWTATLRAFAADLRDRVDRVREHGEYAGVIVANPTRMRAAGAERPALDVGFTWGHAPTGIDGHRLACRAIERAGGLDVRLVYDARRYTRPTATAIVECLGALLDAAARDADTPVGALSLGAPAGRPGALVDARGEAETFDFGGEA